MQTERFEKMVAIWQEIIILPILKWVKILIYNDKNVWVSKWQFVQKIVGALPRSLAFTDSCKRFSFKMML